jgi:glycosyltransferase involved in cell wall biosynthesis
MDKLIIVIPAYNEEANLPAVIAGWHAVAEELGGETVLVVVNDGSKDATGTVLKNLATTHPRLVAIDKPNGGHGSACLLGYEYAVAQGADYVFQTDSDGQTLPEEFPAFWERRGEFDAVIGYRRGRQDGFSRKVVTKVLKLVVWVVFGQWLTDINTPFRLMRADLLSQFLQRIPTGYNLPNVILTVLFARRGKDRVLFLPITFRPRQAGKNSINLKKISRIGLQAVKDFRSLRRALK